MDTDSGDTPANDPPITCTLTSDDATKQVLEWVDLQRHCSAVSAIDGGVRMLLPVSLANEVADLARREAECCAFLTIETFEIDDVVAVDISSPSPDARPVISALAGIPLP